MTAPDLKPCPFCGSKAEMSDNLVSCSYCLCSMPNGFGYEGNTLGYDTEAEAIAAWNTRTTPMAEALAVPEVAALVEVLRWISQGEMTVINGTTGESYIDDLSGAAAIDRAHAALRAIGEKN